MTSYNYRTTEHLAYVFLKIMKIIKTTNKKIKSKKQTMIKQDIIHSDDY